jgi:hypothetical protein
MLSVPGFLLLQITIKQTQHQAANYRVANVNVLALVKLASPHPADQVRKGDIVRTVP